MITTSLTTEGLRTHIEESYIILRDIHDALPALRMIAAGLTPVSDLEDFRARIQALYDNLALLSEASGLILNTSSYGILLLTAGSIAEQRTLLQIGSAASHPTSYFATTDALTSLNTLLNQFDSGFNARVTTLLAPYVLTTALNTAIGNIQAQLGSASSNLTTLAAAVNDYEARIDANTSNIAVHETRLDADDVLLAGVAQSLATVNETISGIFGTLTTQGTAITSLQSRVTTTETGISVLSTSITTLTAQLATANQVLSGYGSAISALQTLVTQDTNGIAVLSSNMTQVQARVTNTETGITALSTGQTALTASVTTLQGGFASQASLITTLQTTIAGVSTSAVTALQTAVNTLTGLVEASYTLTLDVNGFISGFKSVNDGTTAEFTILANKFKIVTPGAGPAVVPFSVEGGNVNVLKDLQMTTGRIVMRAGGFMKVQGIGFGTTNQFIEWFGPEMAINLCSETNGITWIRKDGTNYTGGTSTTPPPDVPTTPVLLLTPTTWSTGDGSAPSSCTFVMSNNGIMTTYDTGVATGARPTGNWMEPVNAANAALYECMATPITGTFSSGSDPTATWLSLDVTRSWLVSRSTGLTPYTKTCQFNLQIRKISVPGTILASQTMQISAFYDDGNGTTPLDRCVVETAYFEDGRQGLDQRPGDSINAFNEQDLSIEEIGHIRVVNRSLQECVRLHLEGGGKLSCSLSAPIPTKTEEGFGYVKAGEMTVGTMIPAKNLGVAFWDKITEVEPVGLKFVTMINAAESCFYAGEHPDYLVGHHNIYMKDPLVP